MDGNNIPIDQILISRITRLPYQGRNLVEEFMGKDRDYNLADNMKNKYDMIQGKRGSNINLIGDQAILLGAHIFIGKIMRKCHANEVLAWWCL